jgi:two-component system, LuxR family, response regulator FixJ
MGNQTRQHIFFVDDNAGIRKATVKMLSDLGCEITCFEKAADCLKRMNSQSCDLLITDVRMPGIDGLALLSRVKRIAPNMPVMVISGYGNVGMAVLAMKMGATDFLIKPFDRDDFLKKVRSILKQSDGDASSFKADLTKVEKNVLQLIINGKSNKEIAHLVHRSLRTIEWHRGHIMQKLGVDNPVDLTKKTIALGLASVTNTNS